MIWLHRIMPDTKGHDCLVNENNIQWILRNETPTGETCTMIYMANGPELYVFETIEEIEERINE